MCCVAQEVEGYVGSVLVQHDDTERPGNLADHCLQLRVVHQRLQTELVCTVVHFPHYHEGAEKVVEEQERDHTGDKANGIGPHCLNEGECCIRNDPERRYV
uniref:Secreted protein n=1 Tax=Steinernema glaseri TaxID=37863 RepID=A0A1I8A9S4_9BILA